MSKSQVCGWLLVLGLGTAAFLGVSHGKRVRTEGSDRAVTLSGVAAPHADEVCFSPREPCDLKLIRLIDGAERSIDMAIYDINLQELVEHIAAQTKRVRVRIVVDRRQAQGEHSLVGALIEAGVPLRYGNQRGIMHDKFVIIDGRLVELGSFNYTNHAARANQENQLYTASPKVVGRYATTFEEMWRSAASH